MTAMHGDAEELELRTARPGDAGAIARIFMKTWRAACKGVLPPAVVEGLDARERMQQETRRWKHAIRTDLVLVASLGSDVVGFASAGPEAEEDPFFRSELKALCVLPEEQRRGIGSGLLFEALQLVPLPALVWVSEQDHGARAFYEAFGALPVRRRNETLGGVEVPRVGYAFFEGG